ncbi:MAG: DNA-protecting protein DprA [Veillonellaceae bacterium]|jgi:DNA processing protein|nr:DNA-protecting protein DprA [Veillonellaceae bacterium]
MDKYYLAAFHMVEGIGNAGLQRLVDFFGGAKNAWFADRKSLFSSRLFSDTICNNLLDHREKIDVHKIAAEWEKKRIKLCTISDEEYPNLLRNTFKPPVILYYRGTLPAANDYTIAIVGARRATAYGKNAAGMLAAELAASGFWVVSGGARGIDSSAHAGALKNGRTIAVLGSGVDVVYPPENRRLFDNIAEAGAVVSEYPPGTLVHAAHFPARNRIISGLSLGTIIIEAARKSGALITADFALEQGRDVFAVPGSIFSELSKGTNYLIKQGAKLVDSASDILEEYDIKANTQQKDNELSIEEMQIYSVLSYEVPIGIEKIVMKTNLTPSVVTYILLQLELRGLVDGQSGQRYVRVAREGIN